ncbi:hypothetical protein N7488_005060 [Penicillium malachiteum]|nr:hypothetical protein N7488_005060 [Penicillium malachiteum]
MSNTVQSEKALYEFLIKVLPEMIPSQTDMAPHLRIRGIETPMDFIDRLKGGIKKAPMAVRLSPHILKLERPDKRSSTSICPVYCRFCFRSYTVGAQTETVKKQRFLPIIKQWKPWFHYIEKTPALRDIMISGGDTYLLEPEQLRYIGDRLLSIPHIHRFLFATKGLSVSPSRLLDPQDHWVTRLGAQRLYEAGVAVRNQTVLLNGINNTPEKMCALVNVLSDMNIQPYYVYRGDIVPGAEDLRTPMQDSLDLERAVSGQVSGFLVPNFILDLPAEGGKRLTRGVESYDRRIALSKLAAPGLKCEPVTMEYWNTLWSLFEEGRAEVFARFGDSKAGAKETG